MEGAAFDIVDAHDVDARALESANYSVARRWTQRRIVSGDLSTEAKMRDTKYEVHDAG